MRPQFQNGKERRPGNQIDGRRPIKAMHIDAHAEIVTFHVRLSEKAVNRPIE